MRITNNIIQSNAAISLQQNLQRMVRAQTQVNTGLRYQTFAEDPHAQSSVMQSDNSLRALAQYRRNIADATSRTQQEDTILDQISTALDRARELGVQESSASSTAATRSVAKIEIDNLIDFVVNLGNSKYNGGYLFGGDDITNPPISNTPPFYTAATPPAGAHTTEISAGQLFKSNHNAKELLLDTNVLQSLKDLSNALGSGGAPQVATALGSVINAHSSVQALVGDLGARENQLDVTGSNLDALETNLKTFKSSLNEVDQEEAITELVSRQTAYQAAMLATSRVMGMTLTDYLQ